MERVKILIADDIEDTRAVVKKILSLNDDVFEVVGEAADGEEVLRKIPIVRPDIILMDINMPKLNGLETTKAISSEYPQIIVVIMSVQAESEYVKKAILHGAKGYIIKPFDYDTLISTLRNTYEKHKEKLVDKENIDESSMPAQIISLFSSKGGVGKSMVALNAAIVLSKEHSKRVMLLDMDLQAGDIASYVNQNNFDTMLEAIEDRKIEYYDNIKEYMYSYNDTLDIFFAPSKPEASKKVNKERIEKIINVTGRHYDFIIIDTGIGLTEENMFVLDLAQLILYVTTTDRAAVKNTRLGLNVMQTLGYDEDKVKLIVNRSNADYGMKKEEIERNLDLEIFALLPEEDKNVAISLNKGEPLCSGAKYYKLKIGKAIDELCENIIDELE